MDGGCYQNALPRFGRTLENYMAYQVSLAFVQQIILPPAWVDLNFFCPRHAADLPAGHARGVHHKARTVFVPVSYTHLDVYKRQRQR